MTLAVGGTAATGARRHPVWLLDARDGKLRHVIDVAGNSITDIVATPEGRFVFASADASWGCSERTSRCILR